MNEHNYIYIKFERVIKKNVKCNRNSNLHCSKWNVTTRNSSNNVNDESSNIDSELKLDKFLNVGVDWSPPADNLHISEATQI